MMTQELNRCLESRKLSRDQKSISPSQKGTNLNQNSNYLNNSSLNMIHEHSLSVSSPTKKFIPVESPSASRKMVRTDMGNSFYIHKSDSLLTQNDSSAMRIATEPNHSRLSASELGENIFSIKSIQISLFQRLNHSNTKHLTELIKFLKMGIHKRIYKRTSEPKDTNSRNRSLRLKRNKGL